ncbi:hypothetical protein H5410_012421 [Solanum commersonii]|uniref:Uncharacterized protein n=1 Tax=Solanum commersonii TaxID=4109 RepID=A0A9J6ASD5_SOLCO|nr:hypothetical protein H5410_012421 [Solanum commersonii]
MKSRLEVNLYKPLDVEKREIFSVFISKKEEERKMYLNGRFNYRLGEHDRSIFLFESASMLMRSCPLCARDRFGIPSTMTKQILF